MINKVLLIGHLGRDPEIRHLEGGSSLARFSVATNENFQDKNQQWQTLTEWHEIVAWRNLATRAESTLKKGMLVYIEGKLRTRKWQDSEGKDRYSTEVVANTFRILEKRERSDEPGFDSDFPGTEKPKSVEKPESNLSPEDDIDDLPF